MNNLTNGKMIPTIPSYEVAKMMEKDHSKLLRDIEGDKTHVGIIPTLIEAQLGLVDYFIESEYKDIKGEMRKCYECTKMGCELLANKMNGKKGILFTAKYVKKFNEMELKIIEQREVLGKEFKIYGTIENPLFLAKDVAEWIEHSDVSMMLRKVDEDEKLIQTLFVSGQNREMWFLTEDGLYEVLMQSRKPIAKQFKKKVKEILKQIRLTGGYIPTSQEDTDAEIMAKALLIAQKTIENKDKLIKQLEPKAEMYDRFIDKEATWGFRDLRKELESTLGYTIKENELKEIMRSKGWIGQSLKALSYAIRNKYMVTKDIEDRYGNPRVQDRFTSLAREELLDYFKNK